MLNLALVDRGMLSKSLIQLSADGWDCAPLLLVVWPELTQSWKVYRLNVRATADLQKRLKPTQDSQDCYCQGPCPCGRTLPVHTSRGNCQTLIGRTRSVS